MRPNLLFFRPLGLNLLEIDTSKLQPYSPQAQKELIVLPLALAVCWNYSFASFFANLNSSFTQNALFNFGKLKNFV